ncbi:Putative Flavoprotein-like superfamily [Septoria linicola]|uniref:NADPH-dependent diflavin oxidoreductase 1 n=1 Tax=Septoria linicola TaxID=215465 RepID=A0A9Q9AT02_9PEZI|nr:putative Flavoprotein-like superfamily [Septoria linicola]USW52000.1 Putative Flavoprotein-like superfamily [Septoria linicola]
MPSMGIADHDDGALAQSTQAQRVPSRTALVLYGSETGNAQDAAEEIGRMTERLRFDTTVLDLDSVVLRDLVKPTVVIFSVSTTGQGEMPQNARGFWKKLLSSALKPGILRKLRFSSFGLGDSSYARYNVAHRLICGRLTQLGAQSFCDRGEGNEQHPEGHSAGFREWIVQLKQSLIDAFPLPADAEVISDDVFVAPKWKLVTSADGATDKSQSGGMKNQDDTIGAIPTPSPALMPLINSHPAIIERNDRITASGHFQDVRLLDMRIDRSLPYGPGAVAVIYPKNFPEDVQAFIELMGWQDIADEPLLLATSQQLSSNELSTPSPLRHINLSNILLTLRWLLENVLDIMSIPRRSFFAELVHFAGNSTEDEDYQKERLLELANPELIDELWDYTTRPKRTILEAMMDFTLIKIPWQYALTALPIMRGRQFSIASGGTLKADDAGRTRVQLLIAIVDPPSPIIKYRRRYGVCTRYIATLKEKQAINIGIQQGYLDVHSSELEVPVVMIGPGTGVAPMRSMVHERLAWAKASKDRALDQALKGDMLFFGCRNEASDYFFRYEWHAFAQDNALSVCTAFSRDQDKPREYVQDQIRLNGVKVCEALLQHDGKVYVCGSSGNMPKGVREALLGALAEHGSLSTTEAESYLEKMEKSGRYKQETW